MTKPCPFCEIGAGRAPATIVREWEDTFAILPLGQVVHGHMLIIPRTHARNSTDSLGVTARTHYCAAELARDQGITDFNIITNNGEAATQSVFHLHAHLIPRAFNDGVALPWYSGRGKKKAAPKET